MRMFFVGQIAPSGSHLLTGEETGVKVVTISETKDRDR